MLRIGLTGGIGSGKSTVATLFAELGAPVIDTDEISRALTAPGQEAVVEIIRVFGTTVRDAAGALDRAALRQLVFRDDAQRRRLEGILHPLIRRETERRLAALRAPYVIVVAPLLLESGFADLVDRILVVDSSEENQVKRVHERNGLAETEVRRILTAQVGRTARLARADDIIINDSDTAHLAHEVQRLDRKYRAVAAATIR
jgi:dephospho-CoA kinase